MSKFDDWLFLREAMSVEDAAETFSRMLHTAGIEASQSYTPGSVIDPVKLRSDYRKLAMKVHPDVGGSHGDMVNVIAANSILNQVSRIPGVTGPAYTEPPKPEPKPARRYWADPSLHSADRRTFGEWLHGGMVEAWDVAGNNVNARNENKLNDAISKVGNVVGEMKRAFDEWKLKTRADTLLTIDNFMDLLEALQSDESTKSMRLALKRFRERFMHPFYDNYIKDFPPH